MAQNAFCASPPSTASTAAQTAPQLRNRALPVPGDMTVSASIGRSPVSGTALICFHIVARVRLRLIVVARRAMTLKRCELSGRQSRQNGQTGRMFGCICPVHVQNCPHGYRELTPSLSPTFRRQRRSLSVPRSYQAGRRSRQKNRVTPHRYHVESFAITLDTWQSDLTSRLA